MSQISHLEQYSSSELLEEYLGSPCNSDNEFSFKHSIELDEKEEYPEAIKTILEQWDFHHHYIPQIYGGKLKSYEELLSLMRLISRRDLTVAIGHGKTYLGSVCIWVGSEEEQKYKLAKVIKEQKQVSLGLTEKTHGSDLVANEVEAIEVEDGYLLSGEKWLINNATRGKAITVFAKTDNNGNSRSFSVFLVEKDKLDSSSYHHLDKIKTHGIRGADISGISFQNCLIPKESLIGKRGSGLEITLKSLQITRTICAGLSLGAADTGLRSTLDFALSRKLYGDSVFAIPHAQKLLVDAFLDILICDCVAIAVSRGLHIVTDQMSVWSAIVKYFVPTTVEKVLHNLSIVLGARYYLRETHWWGIFQKMVRDSAIVSLFDGSTVVNLHAIVLQLKYLAKQRERIDIDRRKELSKNLENIFSLDKPLPELNPNQLELFNRGNDEVLQGLDITLAELKTLQESAEVESEVMERVITLSIDILNLLKKQDEILKNLPNSKGHSEPPEFFELAQQYCNLFAASACIHMWIHNRTQLGDFFAKGEWLVLCLERLKMSFHHTPSSLPVSYRQNVAQELLNLHKQDKLFSIVPIQLAQTQA
ncbi:MAG: acyl-CoA dehydrogenase [Scytonema sp. PMC 1069.18]|nr:acyl-CoA dehydrogenase [Scytonema sp. PMC 1069.18]MEC4881339.1 acyl-CoA dehydrogenase [Scytonema sp. PMC 1070.18]